MLSAHGSTEILKENDQPSTIHLLFLNMNDIEGRDFNHYDCLKVLSVVEHNLNFGEFIELINQPGD